MHNETVGNEELVSALVDGELDVTESVSAVDVIAGSGDGLIAWREYHLIGDALRGSALPLALDGDRFVARLRVRLAEQELTRPLPQPAESSIVSPVADWQQDGSNDPAIRWKMVAGFASLVAVATAGWHLASLQASQGAAQLAAVPSQAEIVGRASGSEPQSREAAAAPAMLRDSRLDELLAAHKQFGGTSALQMPAGFLRNATFDSAQR
jgi:sigma-E factor negative regulatory protein RseA